MMLLVKATLYSIAIKSLIRYKPKIYITILKEPISKNITLISRK